MAQSHIRTRSSIPAALPDMDDEAFKERVLFALRHQIRPADEVDAVRRAMAGNLARALGRERLSNPLALLDPDTDPAAMPPPSDCQQQQQQQEGDPDPIILSPAQREFVEAARAAAEQQAEFARAREEHNLGTTSTPQHRGGAESDGGNNGGEERAEEATEAELEAELLRLRARKAGLEARIARARAAIRHAEELGRQPAADGAAFLDPAAVFRGCDPLPEMPRELMDGFTRDGAAAEGRARDLLQRVRRESVRQKVLVQRERERRDADAAAAADEDGGERALDNVSPEVQLHALQAVKDALIAWIETQLSKAGDGEEDADEGVGGVGDADEAGSPRQGAKEKEEDFDFEARTAEIQREYNRHVELRREILALLSYHEGMTKEWSRVIKEEKEKEEAEAREERRRQRDGGGDDKSSSEPAARDATPTPASASSAALITPYIEKLQAVAREQKGLAQEKSHVNAALARHRRETREMLGHLAEESQLLARFPSASRTAGHGNNNNNNSDEPPSSADFGEATRAAGAMKDGDEDGDGRAGVGSGSGNGDSLTSLLEPWLVAADAAKLATLETVAEKVEEGQMAVDEALAALDEAAKVLNKEEDGEDDVNDGEAAARTKKDTKGKSIYAKLNGNLGLINE